MAAVLYRLGAFSVRRRRVVVLGWVLLLIGLGGAAGALSAESNDAFSVPGTESERALALLDTQLRARAARRRASSSPRRAARPSSRTAIASSSPRRCERHGRCRRR